MSGLCGWIGTTGSTADNNESLTTMAAGLIGTAQHNNCRQSGTGRALATANDASLHAVDGDPIWTAVEGRPSWRDTELAAIAAHEGHSAALKAGYKRYGRNCITYLSGDWSAALIDADSEYALVAIDFIGLQPMAFAILTDGIAFGSTVDCVRTLPAVDVRLNHQAVYDLLYFTRVSAPETIYNGIRKLGPGQAVELTNGAVDIWQYSRISYAKTSKPDEQVLAEELRQTVRRAVARCMEDTNPEEIGAFLSGGVDSSTVTGMLAELSPVKARAFTVGFDAPGYDEMEFAAAAAEHYGVEHRHYYVTPDDIVEFLPQMAQMYDEPFANGSAVPAFYCARQAHEAGIKVMLAGDGGDELFAGNERYMAQRPYERYHDIPAWLRHWVIEPLVTFLPDDPSSLLGKPRRYVLRSNIQLPERLESYNHFGAIPGDVVFTQETAIDVDTRQPLETMRRHFNAPESASILDRMMYLDLQTTIADDDLRKVSRTAEMNGIEVRYPLLDEEVVNFSARLPESIQVKGGELRWFFKHAMRNFLPQSTLNKSKHGFGLPFDLWIRTDDRLRDYAYGKVSDLSRRNILRQDFINTTIAAHRKGDSESSGQLLWAMLLLELWFENRHDETYSTAARKAASS